MAVLPESTKSSLGSKAVWCRKLSVHRPASRSASWITTWREKTRIGWKSTRSMVSCAASLISDRHEELGPLARTNGRFWSAREHRPAERLIQEVDPLEQEPPSIEERMTLEWRGRTQPRHEAGEFVGQPLLDVRFVRGGRVEQEIGNDFLDLAAHADSALRLKSQPGI